LEGAINQSLAKVENYIRRELFHRATLNEIPAGFLQPQALLDEVFLEVSSHSDVRPENIPLEQWMLQVARRTIRQRMEALEEDQKQPHIEETAADPSRWEDEDLHFHQPDEVLRLQDLLRSEQSASPEQLLQREEAQEKLQKDIARLPESLRESFVLFVLEGLNSDEIAMITGKDPTVVLEDVKKARHRLRQREAN
jgi:RNA polymerase sigma factor (sigma-70 family)